MCRRSHLYPGALALVLVLYCSWPSWAQQQFCSVACQARHARFCVLSIDLERCPDLGLPSGAPGDHSPLPDNLRALFASYWLPRNARIATAGNANTWSITDAQATELYTLEKIAHTLYVLLDRTNFFYHIPGFPNFTRELITAELQSDVYNSANLAVLKPPATEEDRIRLQRLHHIFAWKSFLALNWPTDDLGKPRASLTAAGQPRWSGWKDDHEIFKPDGSQPSPWGHHEEAPAPGQPAPAKSTPYLHNLNTTANLASPTLALQETTQAFADPLWDQHGNLVYYQILLNKEGFDYIKKHALYHLQGQIDFYHNTANGQNASGTTAVVNMPWGTFARQDEVGTIALKLAWKVLDAGDIPERFYTMQADVLETDARGKPTWTEKTVGLVGMHIARKTFSAQQQWIWSTFEHVDNLQVNDMEVLAYGDGVLFQLSSELAGTVDNARERQACLVPEERCLLPQALRQAFETHKVSLTPGASIFKESHASWTVKDKLKYYKILKSADKSLRVYGKRLQPLFYDYNCEVCPINHPPTAEAGTHLKKTQVMRAIPIPRAVEHLNHQVQELLRTYDTLFVLQASPTEELDSGHIPAALRRRLDLSDSAVVLVEDQGQQWRIQDATQRYALRLSMGQLHVSRGSVWQYYALIDTQWPTEPMAPPTRPGAGLESITNKAGGKPTPVYLTNAVMETYFQQGNRLFKEKDMLEQNAVGHQGLFGTESCMGCHAAGGIAVASVGSGARKKAVFQAGTADFSWLLQKKAHWSTLLFTLGMPTPQLAAAQERLNNHHMPPEIARQFLQFDLNTDGATLQTIHPNYTWYVRLGTAMYAIRTEEAFGGTIFIKSEEAHTPENLISNAEQFKHCAHRDIAIISPENAVWRVQCDAQSYTLRKELVHWFSIYTDRLSVYRQ